MLRRLHFGNQPAGQGGGGGPTPAFVAWGPDFGGVDGDRYNIGVQTSMPALGLAKNQGIGVNSDLFSIAGNYNAQSIGIHTDGVLGPNYNAQSIGVDHDMPTVEVNFLTQAGIRLAHTMPSLALSHAKTIGVHLSGSVLGAPFWQSVAVQTSTGIGGSDPSIVITKPAGTVDGDLLLACVAVANGLGAAGFTFTTPSGWTQVGTKATVGFVAAAVYRRVASGEPADYTFAGVGGYNNFVGCIQRVNAIDGTTPINTDAQGSASVADPVVPSVTTTVANCLVFYFCAHIHVLSESHTPPASHVERSETLADAGTPAVTLDCGTRVFASAGATGTATINCSEIAASDAAYFRVAVAPGSLVIAP